MKDDLTFPLLRSAAMVLADPKQAKATFAEAAKVNDERRRARARRNQAAYRRRHPDRVREQQRNARLRMTAEQIARYRAQDAERARLRTSKGRRHGLGEGEFDAMLERQVGLCAGCHLRVATEVDHDHRCCPGAFSCGNCIRGLLCGPCNRALGILGENTATLLGLVAYLG